MTWTSVVVGVASGLGAGCNSSGTLETAGIDRTLIYRQDATRDRTEVDPAGTGQFLQVNP